MKTITHDELIRLAVEAGFVDGDDTIGLSGETEFDETLYVEEYPVGEQIKRLVELLGVEVA